MNPLLEIRNVSISYHTVSGETKALLSVRPAVENPRF